MRASLRALLEGLIDYAGLFPPAKLPLPEALANYERYRAGPDAWMLGRFVCPASRLKELGNTPIPCSALLTGGDTPDNYRNSLAGDLARVVEAGAAVEALEVKLPASALDSLTATRVCLEYDWAVPSALPIFFEAPVKDAPSLDRLLALMGLANSLGGRGGFKLRAGGLEASAFPSATEVGHALRSCVTRKRPFKATAGLHHPLPRFEPGMGAKMHGFVNLFAAGVLAHARGLSVERIAELLDDADPASFVFTDDELRWRDLAVTTAEVREARRTAVISFGSCSFDEPRDDLRALGWM
jgi:hypothetical protein